jgi:hypothetical protein
MDLCMGLRRPSPRSFMQIWKRVDSCTPHRSLGKPLAGPFSSDRGDDGNSFTRDRRLFADRFDEI